MCYGNAQYYNPLLELCLECSRDWWFTVYKQQFDYTNESITIIKRDKEETEAEVQKSEDEEKPNNLNRVIHFIYNFATFRNRI